MPQAHDKTGKHDLHDEDEIQEDDVAEGANFKAEESFKKETDKIGRTVYTDSLQSRKSNSCLDSQRLAADRHTANANLDRMDDHEAKMKKLAASQRAFQNQQLKRQLTIVTPASSHVYSR